uniref:Uncharacterized protein n=1 Tax=Glossina pallidipes TaxID=7398 RepID=A0A1A9Z9I7_GLOPL
MYNPLDYLLVIPVVYLLSTTFGRLTPVRYGFTDGSYAGITKRKWVLLQIGSGAPRHERLKSISFTSTMTPDIGSDFHSDYSLLFSIPSCENVRDDRLNFPNRYLLLFVLVLVTGFCSVTASNFDYYADLFAFENVVFDVLVDFAEMVARPVNDRIVVIDF